MELPDTKKPDTFWNFSKKPDTLENVQISKPDKKKPMSSLYVSYYSLVFCIPLCIIKLFNWYEILKLQLWTGKCQKTKILGI